MQSELPMTSRPIQLPKPSGCYKKNLVKKIREVLANIDLSDEEMDGAFQSDAQLASRAKAGKGT